MRFTLSNGPGRRLAAAIRFTLALSLWLSAMAALAIVYRYGAIVPLYEVPDEIAAPTADVPSQVVSARGFLLGGLERGAQRWTEYDEISTALVRALIATEDARFLRHSGVDAVGLARAALANWRAGRVVQGGSTITQQLAKSFIGDARTFERKLAELVIARRLEVRFSKREIFEAYANRIYFGAGATGVGAASRIYFGVDPSELTLAQSALLASIVPAPGRYNPHRDHEAALERRSAALDRLDATGLATPAELSRARRTDLGLVRARESRVVAPEIERAVWRELAAVDSQVDWRLGGRRISTSADLARQRVAQRAVRDHLFALDRRQGHREHLAHLAADGEIEFRRAWEASAFSGEATPALVTAVGDSSLTVWSGVDHELQRSAWDWASPHDVTARAHGATIDRPASTFTVGDVVLLHEALGVVQFPRVEAAALSFDLASGAIEALVGGFDAERSEFDRALQGCRQPGSTFKPIVYSAALDRGFTAATLLRDGPLRVELDDESEWRPRNADGAFAGHVTLWEAMVASRNLAAVSVAQAIGPEPIVRRAQTLGITSPIDSVESIALGASCLRPVELAAAYATFARTGWSTTPHLVLSSRQLGYEGAHGAPAIASLDGALFGANTPTLARMSALWRWRARDDRPQLSPSNAFVVAWLLSEVVQNGTAAALREVGFETAGKTGTTNAYDAWFAGFTGREVSVVWVGSDANTRPLGRGETGGRLALPLWRDATLPPPASMPVLGAAPLGVEWVSIEPESGRRSAAGRRSVDMPFLSGTAPRREADTIQRVDALEIDRRGRDF